MYDTMTREELIQELERNRNKLGACTLHNPTLCHCIYDVIQTGVIVHDSDASILFGNTKAQEILGLDLPIRGKSIADLEWILYDESGNRIEPGDYPVNKAIAGRRPVNDMVVKYCRPQPDEQCWLRVNAIPLIKGEHLEQVVVSFVDITAEITATIRLRESEESFRAIFENAVMGILIVHRGGQIVTATRPSRTCWDIRWKRSRPFTSGTSLFRRITNSTGSCSWISSREGDSTTRLKNAMSARAEP